MYIFTYIHKYIDIYTYTYVCYEGAQFLGYSIRARGLQVLHGFRQQFRRHRGATSDLNHGAFLCTKEYTWNHIRGPKNNGPYALYYLESPSKLPTAAGRPNYKLQPLQFLRSRLSRTFAANPNHQKFTEEALLSPTLSLHARVDVCLAVPDTAFVILQAMSRKP